MTLNTKTAGQTANSIISEIIDNPNDPEEELNPLEIYNPLDYFEGLDYLPKAIPAQTLTRHSYSSKLQDMLRGLRSSPPSNAQARGTIIDPEDPREEFHKTVNADIRYQPLVLSCHEYLKLHPPFRSRGLGYDKVQSVLDMMNGEKTIPKELEDSSHRAYTMAEEVAEFFPNQWFISNMKDGTLTKYRKDMSAMLDRYPNDDTFSRWQIIGLSRLPQFYDLENFPRSQYFEDAVDFHHRYNNFEKNEVKAQFRKSLKLVFTGVTSSKNYTQAYFKTDKEEIVTIRGNASNCLYINLLDELAKSSIKINVEVTNATLQVRENWVPFRLITGRLVGYHDLKINQIKG